MSRYTFWAVLTPGEPAWLESRARAIVMTEADEEDGKEPPFEVIPGSGRYHAIVGLDPMGMGAELQIAEEVSLECDEPVYSILLSAGRAHHFSAISLVQLDKHRLPRAAASFHGRRIPRLLAGGLLKIPSLGGFCVLVLEIARDLRLLVQHSLFTLYVPQGSIEQARLTSEVLTQ
jgi:hypothetical protein